MDSAVERRKTADNAEKDLSGLLTAKGNQPQPPPPDASTRPCAPPTASQAGPSDEPCPLPPRQQRAVDLLLSGLAIKDVAKACGVQRQAVWAWRQRPAFQKELARRRWELAREIEGPAIEAALEGLEALMQLAGLERPDGGLRDEETRLRAAAVLAAAVGRTSAEG